MSSGELDSWADTVLAMSGQHMLEIGDPFGISSFSCLVNFKLEGAVTVCTSKHVHVQSPNLVLSVYYSTSMCRISTIHDSC